MSKSTEIFGQIAASVNSQLESATGQLTMKQLSDTVANTVAGVDKNTLPHIVRFHVGTLPGITIKKGKGGGVSVDKSVFKA